MDLFRKHQTVAAEYEGTPCAINVTHATTNPLTMFAEMSGMVWFKQSDGDTNYITRANDTPNKIFC